MFDRSVSVSGERRTAGPLIVALTGRVGSLGEMATGTRNLSAKGKFPGVIPARVKRTSTISRIHILCNPSVVPTSTGLATRAVRAFAVKLSSSNSPCMATAQQ
jgi:hypothetical protein